MPPVREMVFSLILWVVLVLFMVALMVWHYRSTSGPT